MKENNETKNFFTQKSSVIKKWESLAKDLDELLILAKKAGGTKGHSVGSIKDKNLKLLEFTKNNW